MIGSIEILILVVLILMVIVIRRRKKNSNQLTTKSPKYNPDTIASLSNVIDRTKSENKSKTCSKCNGTGKIICPFCGGSGRKICGVCGGTGRRFVGITKFNPSGYQNCQSCFGGRTNCNCMQGKVACSNCGGKGIFP